MHDTPEAELVSLSKQDHPAAIAELFRRHDPATPRLARGILRDTDDAQDAVQKAYFLAFSRLDHFRCHALFKTWISRIVVNGCLLRIREARRRSLSHALARLPKHLRETYTLSQEVLVRDQDQTLSSPHRIPDVAPAGLVRKARAETRRGLKRNGAYD